MTQDIPRHVLPETAEALRETADLIEFADSEMMARIAKGFSAAHATLDMLRSQPGQDMLTIAGTLGQVGADLQLIPGQAAWAGWTLWSIKCELAALSRSDPRAVDELLPEANRLVALVMDWIERQSSRGRDHRDSGAG